MNTTMADGAEQRLDAQIAEALFGQPGMSKMDVANRVRELRGDGPALLDAMATGGSARLGDSRSTRAATFLRQYLTYLRSSPRQGLRPRWCDVYEALGIAIEALSAQPSPGGQGDALRSFACEAVEYFRNRSDVVDGDYGSPSPNEEMKLLSEGEAALAARQPVGQIPDTEIDARLNALYREMVDGGQHNGGMSGVAWDRAVYRMAASQPGGAGAGNR